MHYPLAVKAGLDRLVADQLAQGRRPDGMKEDEALAYDFCDELFRTHGVCDATYARAVARLGERGVVDLLGLVGYFTTVSMVMNVARTPASPQAAVEPLAGYPM